mmetsp:Transcript_11368/g.21110  ORF Transcript_11368/g.21110 Transcript_11368/m.21110 type:complete len:298 (-) Transcript_11368:231-1124(-)
MSAITAHCSANSPSAASTSTANAGSSSSSPASFIASLPIAARRASSLTLLTCSLSGRFPRPSLSVVVGAALSAAAAAAAVASGEEGAGECKREGKEVPTPTKSSNAASTNDGDSAARPPPPPPSPPPIPALSSPPSPALCDGLCRLFPSAALAWSTMPPTRKRFCAGDSSPRLASSRSARKVFSRRKRSNTMPPPLPPPPAAAAAAAAADDAKGESLLRACADSFTVSARESTVPFSSFNAPTSSSSPSPSPLNPKPKPPRSLVFFRPAGPVFALSLVELTGSPTFVFPLTATAFPP